MATVQGAHPLLMRRAESPLQQMGVHGLYQQDAMEEDEGSPIDPEIEEYSGEIAEKLFRNFFSTDSTSTDSSDEQTSQVVLEVVYRDPLDECMEGLEALATGILRTGKLTVQGEPGDMTKLQPILFGLQPMERDLPQLIPQLLQSPLYNQTDQDSHSGWAATIPSALHPEDFLASGHIRLGVPVDTAIYHLLHSHCAKGAKQAEELIKTAQTITHSLRSPRNHIPQMPPIIFSSSLGRHRQVVRFSPTFTNGYHYPNKRKAIATPSTAVAGSATASHPRPSSQRDSDSGLSTGKNTLSASSLELPSKVLTPSEGSSTSLSPASDHYSSPSLRSSTSSQQEPESHNTNGDSTPIQSCDGLAGGKSTPKDLNHQKKPQGRRRKMSEYCPPLRHTSSSDMSGEDEFSLYSPTMSRRNRPIPDSSKWNTCITDNGTIVGMYGDTTYPLLMWNPNLKVDFKLSSSHGLLSSMVTGINPDKPTVTIKVINHSPYRVAFSIRAYRQSTPLNSHVVYPTQGLSVVEQYQCWEENAEFYPQTPQSNEHFIIDLLVCTLDGQPSWNVIRKYAVMKAAKSPNGLRTRKPSKRSSHFQMPGSPLQKDDNLRQVISHGLQCVVKSKLDEAETIFSQALYLADFQRIPIKAFVYICLAVVANKRRKAGQIPTLIPVLTYVNNATQLVDVCEAPPGVTKMPRMLQLVKQLRKELNITKILKDHRKGGGKTVQFNRSQEESEEVGPEGGTLFINATVITLPPGALETNTKITLNKPGTKHLATVLNSTGWDKTVEIVTALHIQCSPPTDHFEKPIEISSMLAGELQVGPLQSVRLLQSNYLRQWQDITDDPQSKIIVSGNKIHITTDHIGWLAVAVVQLDISKIAELAMRALSIDPITLRLSAYGQSFPNNILQVAVFVNPCQPNGEPVHQDEQTPLHHSSIAFPHTVQAWPGQRLRLHLQGKFEPDTTSGERDLCWEFEVPQTHNHICEKWVKLTSQPGQPLSGKLMVNSLRNPCGAWESVTEMNLSCRSGYVSSSSSSDNPQS